MQILKFNRMNNKITSKQIKDIFNKNNIEIQSLEMDEKYIEIGFDETIYSENMVKYVFNMINKYEVLYTTILFEKISSFNNFNSDNNWLWKDKNGGHISWNKNLGAIYMYNANDNYVQFGYTNRLNNNRYSFNFRFGNADKNGHVYFRFYWAYKDQTAQAFEIHHTDDSTNQLKLVTQDSGWNLHDFSTLNTIDFQNGQQYSCVIETFEKFVKIFIDGTLITESGNDNGFTNASELPYSYGSWYFEVVPENNNDHNGKFSIRDFFKVEQRIGG